MPLATSLQKTCSQSVWYKMLAFSTWWNSLSHDFRFHTGRHSWIECVPEGEGHKSEWFAITADCWTCRANEVYIDVTFHTITRNGSFSTLFQRIGSFQNSTQLPILEKQWWMFLLNGDLICLSWQVPLLTMLSISRRPCGTSCPGNVLAALDMLSTSVWKQD